MKIAKKVAGILMALLLILGGVGHFLNPEAYTGFIPDFLPEQLVNWGVGFLELALGVGVFIPPYRKLALRGIALLMIAFLPIHVIDVLQENPAIGSRTAAIVRLGVQFVFIYLPWFARRG
ncbi:MAG: hypothetical protein RIB47_08945 [Cyclobacteriaceae bacterium]